LEGSYCVPSAEAGLSQEDALGGDSASCTALCLEPNEAICTPVSSGGAEDEHVSACAAYSDKHCCKVSGSTETTYEDDIEGVCNLDTELDPAIEEDDGSFTQCKALGLISSAALVVALIH